MKKYTKEESAVIVVQCAERYRDELDGMNTATTPHGRRSSAPIPAQW